MKKQTEEITINGTQYVPKSLLKNNIKLADSKKGLTFCIVRTYSAGVFAGWVDLKKINEIMEIKEAIRLWSWKSDFTLSALAIDGILGTKDENKYAMAVPKLFALKVIEIIPCSEKAKNEIINWPSHTNK